MAKVETYPSKAAMKAHEKGEGKKMAMMEKKMGVKDVVKKPVAKKAMPKKMGKKK